MAESFRWSEYPTCPCGGLLAECKLCGGTGKLSECLCHGLGVIGHRREGEGNVRWEAQLCPRCGAGPPRRHAISDGLAEEMRAWTFPAVYGGVEALQKVVERMQRWAEAKKGWLVLSAPWGRGKTYLQASLVNWYRAQGLAGMYWLTNDLLHRLVEAANDRDPEYSFGALYRTLVEVDLLCLDEFGHEALSDWKEAQLRAFLVARSDGPWRPTVFATNEPLDKFAREMPWLWSRWNSAYTRLETFQDVPDLRPRLRDIAL